MFVTITTQDTQKDIVLVFSNQIKQKHIQKCLHVTGAQKAIIKTKMNIVTTKLVQQQISERDIEKHIVKCQTQIEDGDAKPMYE